MANPKGNEVSLVKYKPKWQSGKTQTIRVPMAIANLVLEDAREIDTNGNQSLLEVINSQKEYINNLNNKLSTLEQELSEKNDIISNQINTTKNSVTSDRKELRILFEQAVSGSTKYVTDVKKKVAEIGKLLNFDIQKQGKSWTVTDKRI